MLKEFEVLLRVRKQTIPPRDLRGILHSLVRNVFVIFAQKARVTPSKEGDQNPALGPDLSCSLGSRSMAGSKSGRFPLEFTPTKVGAGMTGFLLLRPNPTTCSGAD